MSASTKKEWEVAEEIYGCWHSGYECFAVDALVKYTSNLKVQRDELLTALKNTNIQLQNMNVSSAHAASWCEPKSNTTTKLIRYNRHLITNVEEAKE